jgi:hypothetical protein
MKSADQRAGWPNKLRQQMSEEIALFIWIPMLRWMMQGAPGVATKQPQSNPEATSEKLRSTTEIYKEEVWCIGMFMQSLHCMMQANTT